MKPSTIVRAVQRSHLRPPKRETGCILQYFKRFAELICGRRIVRNIRSTTVRALHKIHMRSPTRGIHYFSYTSDASQSSSVTDVARNTLHSPQCRRFYRAHLRPPKREIRCVSHSSGASQSSSADAEAWNTLCLSQFGRFAKLICGRRSAKYSHLPWFGRFTELPWTRGRTCQQFDLYT